MQTYEIVPLAELLLRPDARVTQDVVVPHADMIVPELSFGDTELDRPGYDFIGGGAGPMPRGERLPLAPLCVYHFHDAVVWGSQGIITIGRSAVRETVQHRDAALGAEVRGEEIRIPDRPPELRLAEANYLLGGNSDNYYHFLIDILPRLLSPPIAHAFEARATLVPTIERVFQRVLLGLLEPAARPFMPMGRTTSVMVERLTFMDNLSRYGFAAHPIMRRVFDYLSSAIPHRGSPPKRIYIARRGTLNRPLENEAEVLDLVAEAGFVALDLERMPVSDQIRCFRTASHIVAPHGAGLANIMFAAAAPRLLELHMDQYIHWCFRRLSGLRSCTYGCVIGESRRVSDWPHVNSWTLPADRLRAALNSSAFGLP